MLRWRMSFPLFPRTTEFSAVSALTYNFKNPTTTIRTELIGTRDLEASRFLCKQFFVGGVGYYLNQLTGDTS